MVVVQSAATIAHAKLMKLNPASASSMVVAAVTIMALALMNASVPNAMSRRNNPLIGNDMASISPRDGGDAQKERELVLAVEGPEPRRENEYRDGDQSGQQENDRERCPDVVSHHLLTLDQEV